MVMVWPSPQLWAAVHDEPSNRQGLSKFTGGETTFLGTPSIHSFSQPSANLPSLQKADFFIGDSLFQRMWISAPSSLSSSDGLGPLFNSRACQSCHIKDGRGHLPSNQDHGLRSMIVKLALSTPHQSVMAAIKNSQAAQISPEPNYGFQFHDQSLADVPAEGHYTIKWTHQPHLLSAKAPQPTQSVVLKKPQLIFHDLNYGALHKNTVHSLRVAPPMIGLGLIEAIDSKSVAIRHDPHDKDKDGISGRMSMIIDHSAKPTLGRFGWKAAKPSLMSQNLGAFFMDMSMTSDHHPNPYGDCMPSQKKCRTVIDSTIASRPPQSSAVDISTQLAVSLLLYTQNLAPPQRIYPQDPAAIQKILAGERLFYDVGCESCHRAQFTTGSTHPLKHLRHQQIFIYSDLLLHDMGPDLDDGLSAGHALSSEWRTTPLWGLGYTKTINPQAGYLHDGRAQTLTEAILWHGGEAQTAKEAFVQLSPSEQQLMIMFLESL